MTDYEHIFFDFPLFIIHVENIDILAHIHNNSHTINIIDY